MIVYAIGDIHGHFKILIDIYNQILKNLDPAEETTIVFLGDYIDRGEESFEVVDFVKNLKDTGNLKHIFLRGNHEQMLIEYERGDDRYGDFMQNGGTSTWLSYDRNDKTFHDHIDWYERLKWFHRIDNYVFVHAGLHPKKTIDETKNDTFIWAREYNDYKGEYPGNVFVVHGHTPVDKPKLTGNQLDIDTGAAYPRDGYLTAVRIDTTLGPKEFKFFKAKHK